ncbi:hypothetical protein Tco_0640249 [Tanacetum coccineum]
MCRWGGEEGGRGHRCGGVGSAECVALERCSGASLVESTRIGFFYQRDFGGISFRMGETVIALLAASRSSAALVHSPRKACGQDCTASTRHSHLGGAPVIRLAKWQSSYEQNTIFRDVDVDLQLLDGVASMQCVIFNGSFLGSDMDRGSKLSHWISVMGCTCAGFKRVQQSRGRDEIVRPAVVIIGRTESGKQAEALDALRRAKLLEKKLNN